MAPTDEKLPVPSTSFCISKMQTFFAQGIDKLALQIASETELRSLRSLERCREVIQSHYIPSGSMLPTPQINDRVFLDKTAYRNQAPRRGDIVTFQPTKILREQRFTQPFIKRIIGLPGDRVAVKKGSVYINGKPLKEPYIEDRPAYEYGPVVVPANSYFVLGDSRNNAYDSHYWGFVPRNLILGKVVWRFFPLERAGSLAQ